MHRLLLYCQQWHFVSQSVEGLGSTIGSHLQATLHTPRRKVANHQNGYIILHNSHRPGIKNAVRYLESGCCPLTTLKVWDTFLLTTRRLSKVAREWRFKPRENMSILTGLGMQMTLESVNWDQWKTDRLLLIRRAVEVVGVTIWQYIKQSGCRGTAEWQNRRKVW